MVMAHFLMQAAAPPQNQASSILRLIAEGWTHLASGEAGEAAALGERALRLDPVNHHAIDLTLAAYAKNRQDARALDAYERWLSGSVDEDFSLLRSVATAYLNAFAANADPRVSFPALAALATSGDTAALAELRKRAAAGTAPPEIDSELAQHGDADALQRLQSTVTSGGRADKTDAINALKSVARRETPGIIARALHDAAPPSRIAAATALADLGATDQLPALREALSDPDPRVRGMVQIALARLRDPQAGLSIQELLSSPVGQIRLLAARTMAQDAPQGRWTDTAETLLQDDDALVRIDAARLLLEHDVPSAGAARDTLRAALADPTPAVRSRAAEATRMLATSGERAEPKTLRSLLRDQLPEVRLEAARALKRSGTRR
jgi:HEAT repeat protein